jgi:hypothetical protein
VGIVDTAKDVLTLVQKADNIDLVKQVLALQGDILKMMEENRNFKDQVRSLSAEVTALHEKLRIKGKLIHKQNSYFLQNDDGTEDGPFCSVCQDVDHILVRMHAFGTGMKACGACSRKGESA